MDFKAGRITHKVLRAKKSCPKCSYCHYLGTVQERLDTFEKARMLLLAGFDEEEVRVALQTELALQSGGGVFDRG